MKQIPQLTSEIPHLKRFALSLTRSPEDAEDLVQDCLERAISRQHQFRRGTNLRAWLFCILRNIQINKIRRRKCEKSYLEKEKLKPDHWSPGSQEDNVKLGELREAIIDLPRKERMALYWVAIAGLTYEDAGAKLGWHIGTIKSRVHRARGRLAEQDIVDFPATVH